jgi:hypothetical protein
MEASPFLLAHGPNGIGHRIQQRLEKPASGAATVDRQQLGAYGRVIDVFG